MSVEDLAIETLSARVLELEAECQSYRAVACAALDALHELTAKNDQQADRIARLTAWNNALVEQVNVAHQAAA
jgi:hypothetical protein